MATTSSSSSRIWRACTGLRLCQEPNPEGAHVVADEPDSPQRGGIRGREPDGSATRWSARYRTAGRRSPEACFDPTNAYQVEQVTQMARQAQLLGGDPDVFDPSKLRRCSGLWSGRSGGEEVRSGRRLREAEFSRSTPPACADDVDVGDQTERPRRGPLRELRIPDVRGRLEGSVSGRVLLRPGVRRLRRIRRPCRARSRPRRPRDLDQRRRWPAIVQGRSRVAGVRGRPALRPTLGQDRRHASPLLWGPNEVPTSSSLRRTS
jgi:hypothetical protein